MEIVVKWVKIPTTYNRDKIINALPLAVYVLSKKWEMPHREKITKQDLVKIRLHLDPDTLSLLEVIQSQGKLSIQDAVQIALIEINEKHNQYGVNKNEFANSSQ